MCLTFKQVGKRAESVINHDENPSRPMEISILPPDWQKTATNSRLCRDLSGEKRKGGAIGIGDKRYYELHTYALLTLHALIRTTTISIHLIFSRLRLCRRFGENVGQNL